MNTTHRNTRRTVLAAVVIAVAATACSRGDDTPHTAPTTAAPVPPAVIVAIPDLPGDTVEFTPEPTPTTISDGSVNVRKTGNETLDDLFWQDDPTGTGSQIALRFVRALQRRDYLAAAQQLDGGGRLALSGDTMGHLRRVMADVYNNAKLTGAGRCTSASALTRESAVVSCGSRRVVVHVLNTAYHAGVEIDPWHPRYDVYRGPHTHAYTALDL